MASRRRQLPGCTIPRKCLLNPDTALCGSDLKCICAADDHFNTNGAFSSDCMFKECTYAFGRESFLEDWLDSCHQVGKRGSDDIPRNWAPYLPQEGPTSRYTPTHSVILPPMTIQTSSVAVATPPAVISRTNPIDAPPVVPPTTVDAATPALSPPESTAVSLSPPLVPSTFTTRTSTTSLSPTPTYTSTPEPHTTHTARAIGGIAGGIGFILLVCIGLGYFYHKAHRNAIAAANYKPSSKDREAKVRAQGSRDADGERGLWWTMGKGKDKERESRQKERDDDQGSNNVFGDWTIGWRFQWYVGEMLRESNRGAGTVLVQDMEVGSGRMKEWKGREKEKKKKKKEKGKKEEASDARAWKVWNGRGESVERTA